ncbi:DUF4920 domain-containing protein [Mucilaginibacter conchicola]|uniref:DUF4920 domain-containing protein n=1 Tax=Mucilaginibacter conchicola TaxID=2303333 RepID=A0A372NUP7_9SPHI|nr:DUF4920 domain-containing protein [Mucilaginibacter conchicola]RFZ92980.1 DUF4920 domain-containing protein [Mucilaginibacter conchicola]
MKKLALLFLMLCSIQAFAQKKTPLPHGMVFGKKPKDVPPIPAAKLETLMGGKIRQTTAIVGKILKVKKEQGGWFDIDAGNGRIIEAHFADYNIKLPAAIASRTVIIEGVAQRQLIADDEQHLAGDTAVGKKQHQAKVNPKERITFEVQGLMVDK